MDQARALSSSARLRPPRLAESRWSATADPLALGSHGRLPRSL